MKDSINLKMLTPEQRRELLAELEAENQAREARIAEDRESYKQLVVETVNSNFKELTRLSSMISDVKQLVFANFAHILDLKKDLYGVKEGQQTHTFSNADSTVSITIGYRVVDNYDDTVNSGIEKVKDWIAKQAKDAEAAQLVDIINGLLKQDQKGNLKASRVLELQNHADKIKDPELSDGVRIIREAYKPVRTRHFVEVTYTGDKGEKYNLPLSITQAPFPEPEFDVSI